MSFLQTEVKEMKGMLLPFGTSSVERKVNYVENSCVGDAISFGLGLVRVVSPEQTLLKSFIV